MTTNIVPAMQKFSMENIKSYCLLLMNCSNEHCVLPSAYVYFNEDGRMYKPIREGKKPTNEFFIFNENREPLPVTIICTSENRVELQQMIITEKRVRVKKRQTFSPVEPKAKLQQKKEKLLDERARAIIAKKNAVIGNDRAIVKSDDYFLADVWNNTPNELSRPLDDSQIQERDQQELSSESSLPSSPIMSSTRIAQRTIESSNEDPDYCDFQKDGIVNNNHSNNYNKLNDTDGHQNIDEDLIDDNYDENHYNVDNHEDVNEDLIGDSNDIDTDPINDDYVDNNHYYNDGNLNDNHYNDYHDDDNDDRPVTKRELRNELRNASNFIIKNIVDQFKLFGCSATKPQQELFQQSTSTSPENPSQQATRRVTDNNNLIERYDLDRKYLVKAANAPTMSIRLINIAKSYWKPEVLKKLVAKIKANTPEDRREISAEEYDAMKEICLNLNGVIEVTDKKRKDFEKKYRKWLINFLKNNRRDITPAQRNRQKELQAKRRQNRKLIQQKKKTVKV